MSTLEEIKAAAAKLTAEQQFELFNWLIESEAFRKRQLEQLQNEINIGLEQLERGESRNYEGSLTGLADEIKEEGRRRLEQGKSRM
jgi:hypothetical protein